MKIAYLAFIDPCQENGVVRKISYQIRSWIRLGNECCLFTTTTGRELWSGLDGLQVLTVPAGGAINRLINIDALVSSIEKWQPEVVLFRFVANYRPAIGRLMSKFPTFLEINTDDIEEYRLTLSKIRYYYHLLTRDRMLERAVGLISVSRELALKFERYEIPIFVEGNGINLEEYPSLPPTDNPEPVLVFIGTPQPWHGVEKIIVLARQFPGWRFDLIGIDPDSSPVSFPSNVFLHGMLARQEFEPIMQAADVGIGTLALYAKSMDEASPLKVREYLAYGLPVMIGYTDTDIPSGSPFCLQIPNTPQNVVDSFAEIENFVLRWKGKRVPRADIMHFDVIKKEFKRLEFIKATLKSRD